MADSNSYILRMIYLRQSVEILANFRNLTVLESTSINQNYLVHKQIERHGVQVCVSVIFSGPSLAQEYVCNQYYHWTIY